MLVASPTIVMRFGAIQRGTLFTSQHQYPCMKDSRRDRPELLYRWSSNFLSCCRDSRDTGSSISLVKRPAPSSKTGAAESRPEEEPESESVWGRAGLLCELMTLWESALNRYTFPELNLWKQTHCYLKVIITIYFRTGCLVRWCNSLHTPTVFSKWFPNITQELHLSAE